jgi:chromosome segregation ATPase
VKDLSTNISNIVKSYINLSDKIEEAKKRLTEVEDLLQNSKTSYDELWNSLKIKNVSAESIDALNKIILNKSELISKFSKERSTLIDMINSYTKQKQDYDEQIKYIDFYISVSERKLFDWENIKDGWYSDYKELILVFNDTVKNLSVNLISFLFKTINVVIYAVLSIFFILI